MFRRQVYNTQPWESPQTNRNYNQRPKLDRKNTPHRGILDQSRGSNHSNSIRLKRTEQSGQRLHLSRDRDLTSDQASGFASDGFNDSYRKVPRRMGSVLNSSRRKPPPDGNRIQAAGSRSGKNIVENLYMLTNNVPQYSDHYANTQKMPDYFDQVYSNRESGYHYDHRDRYQRIGERRPNNNNRYPQQSPRRYEQRGQKYPQQSPNRYRDHSHDPDPQYSPDPHRYPQNQNNRYRQESYRGRSPNRSVLRSRRSKQGSRLRVERGDGRERQYKAVGNNKDVLKKYPQNQMRRLEEKYAAENIYELKYANKPRGEPRGEPRDRRDKDYRSRDRDMYEMRRSRGDQKYRNHDSRYKDPRRDKGGRNYQEQRDVYRDDHRDRHPPRREDDWYQEDDFERDPYRQDRYQDNGYHKRPDRGRNGQSRRKGEKMASNASGNSNPYYYTDQIPSTTAGIKTLPEISRYDSISDASIPVHSIRSQKELPKNPYGDIFPQKKSLKLDRPKLQSKQKQKMRSKQQKGHNYNPYQQSELQDRWKKNNIRLQQRSGDDWHKKGKKQRVIDDKYEPGNLPSGSVFLPVQSKKVEKKQWAEDVIQKVIVHLQTLNIIADYTQQFKSMYQKLEPWEILIFLTYKKFYIQRTKVINILKSTRNKDYCNQDQSDSAFQGLPQKQNPFTMPYSKISDTQVKKFRQTRECFALMIQLQAQNKSIRDALRGLYNRYIEKSGEHVNMLDCDNFSEEIYKYMKEQLQGISQNLIDPQLQSATRLRMGKIIKTGLLIAYLNGKYIKNFPQIIIHEDMIHIGKRQTLREDNISKLFLQEFNRIIS